MQTIGTRRWSVDIEKVVTFQEDAYTSGVICFVHLHRLLATGAFYCELAEILAVQRILRLHVHAAEPICAVWYSGHLLYID